MEEYEQLEEELSLHYATYLTRFRNLAYLENVKEEMMKTDEIQFPEDDQAIKSAVEDLRKITEVNWHFMFLTQTYYYVGKYLYVDLI